MERARDELVGDTHGGADCLPLPPLISFEDYAGTMLKL